MGNAGPEGILRRLGAPGPWLYLGLLAVPLALTPPDEDVFPIPVSTPDRYLAIAHRGAPLEAPENTIAALDAAVRIGADAVEVDLCLTRDGHVVLWHDVDPSSLMAMARQLGLGPVPHDPDAPPLWSEYRRRIATLSLEEVRAHYGYEEAGVTIPTLPTFMDWLERTPDVEHVFLDIKDDDRVGDTFGHVVAELGRRNLGDRSMYVLSDVPDAFDEMRAILRRHPAVSVNLVLDGKGSILAIARRLSVRHVSLGKRYWEPMPVYLAHVVEVLRARKRGELDMVVVWSFGERSEQRNLFRLGVDGIMSNQVERLVQVRRSMGQVRRSMGRANDRYATR